MENEESLKNLLFNPIPGFESIHGENALKEYTKNLPKDVFLMPTKQTFLMTLLCLTRKKIL